MKTNNIILASIEGTSLMSLFSYAVSFLKSKNFKEPELLGKLIDRIVPGLDKEEAKATGWTLHYLAGYVFAAVYAELLKRTDLKPTILNGLLIGAASSVPALLMWYTVFKLHPNPPKKQFKDYFGHLVLAHVVFGIFTFAGYKQQNKLA